MVEQGLGDHPRIRGEHSPLGAGGWADGGSSPHTRGAREGRELVDGERWIIPAYAGSTGQLLQRLCEAEDHPRIRGEHISAFGVWPGGVGSSPHTRGARSPPEPRPGPPPDHPRIRGEHPTTTSPWPWRSGSSPHTRGALSRGGGLAGRCRIIPAYAGSTVDCVVVGFPEWDHPRIRGEHVGRVMLSDQSIGSSPHTRGALPYFPACGWQTRIIPAYAGSTSSPTMSTSCAWDHPRIRGEHADIAERFPDHDGSSPHTRGARHLPGT